MSSKKQRTIGLDPAGYAEQRHPQFEDIRQRLLSEIGDVPTTTLALNVAYYALFQDRAFGVKGTVTSRTAPKLPATIFVNFDADGPLYVLSYMLLRLGVADIAGYLNALTPEQSIELHTSIRNTLKSRGLLPQFRIVLGISSGLEVQLAKIVTYMGGELVPRRTEPHTHYVVADPNPTAGADDEYVRTLTRTNEKALVHWWYYPDSYDCWIPQQEVQGEVDEPPTLQYPCTVTDRWLRDSFSFNEWMNELDYEPEESEAEEDAPLPQRKSRTKAIEAMKSTIEREQRPDDAIEETDDLEDDKPSRKKRKEMDDTNTQAGAGDSPQEGDEPDKKKRKPNATPKQGVPNGSAPITTPKIPSTKNITAKTVPRQSAQITPLPANKKPSRNSNRSGNYVNITDAYAGIVQTTPLSIRPVASLVLPAHAQWFDMSTVSDYEKQALAEFFSNNPKTPSKTPEVYKEYRDFMIHAYQQNPSQYLSFTACRRSLSGDALAILKVHEFLEQASLINYSVMPDTVGVFPSALPIPEPSSAAQQLLRLDTARQLSSQRVDVNLVNKSFILADHEPTTKKYTCAHCKSLCDDTRFHSTKQDDYVLCKNCYVDGKQLPDHSRNDFVQADAKDEMVDDSANWTTVETLALLDAIKEFGDQSWDKVADHVGTKSAEQCVAHFVRLPIEDPYFVTRPFSLETKSSGAGAGVGVGGSDSDFAFSGFANPIVALLSFLRDGVAPEVSSAAAQAALKTFLELEKKTVPAVAPSSGATGDAMDVDGAIKDAMDIDSSAATKPDSAAEKISQNVKIASTAALAAATLRASLLAEREERDIHRLVYKAVDLQLQKLELKMKYMDELDKVLRDEQTKIDVAHHRLLQDKLSLEESRRANAQKHLELKNQLELQLENVQAAAAATAHMNTPPTSTTNAGISMSQIFPQLNGL